MSTLFKLVRLIDRVNNKIGKTIAWIAVVMVLTQFAVVVLRYVFGIGSIMMQESIVYMHGALFMIGASYTLLHERHVRVDIFYRDASPKTKAIVDLLGSLFFLLPICVVIAWASNHYITTSWAVFEGSRETSGVQAVFLLKSVIWVFTLLVGLQGVSLALRSFLFLKGTTVPHPRDDQTRI